MDVGIKKAKTDLSRLVQEAQSGKRVFLMNRGKRIIELVPVNAPDQTAQDNRGFGMFKDKARLPADWDSQKSRRKATAEVMKLMGIDD
jgi:antitoxin (DNA-binding transcriptional repressor) of toxin-antitoxin stability system